MGNAINMILATCVLIMLVLLFRRLFWKKCNPNLLYFLWIFVALRILVPVNIPYMMSPEIEMQWDFTQNEDILSMPASVEETVKTNISALVSGAVLTDASAPANSISDRDSESGVNLEEPSEYGQILLLIWLCGCILCVAYCLFINVCAFRNIAKRQIGKVNKTVKVYEVEGYNCLVGVWNPHIFITPQVAENPIYRKYVLMHEMEHYKVKDNLWLLIRTICLTIQWFNPLVWIAYFKAQEDCELACDYRVLSHLKKEEKNAYADTLLYLLESNPKTAYLASSMGKAGYKKRLDSIYKKRNAKGFVFLCGVMCIATVLTFVQVTVSRTVNDREAMYLNYSDYSGIWSEEGASYDDILHNGGAEFHVEISNNNELTGYIYVQQGLIGRMAEIENITGIIEDGRCYYPFSDDGWGNSGTLCIQFRQNEIVIEVQDFVLNDENRSGFGIDRTYVMLPMREQTEISNLEMETEETWQAPVLETYDPSWSEERILEELEGRKSYRDNCSFYSEVVDYLENIREVTDISMYVEPLYATDTQRYTEEDFADVPPLIIHLAKNEIYARHGYLFSNEDLYNYFMGQLWYQPSIMKEEFDDNVFNECEIENIKLLANLDTY